MGKTEVILKIKIIKGCYNSKTRFEYLLVKYAMRSIKKIANQRFSSQKPHNLHRIGNVTIFHIVKVNRNQLKVVS